MLFLATIFTVSNRSVSTEALIVLAIVKKAPGTSLKIQFVIFKPWKVLWNYIDYYWSLYCYVRWIFNKVLAKIMQNSNFYRDNLGVQKVLKSNFFRLSKSLKSKILATMVPPLPRGYSGFIINLPFRATRRLERMLLGINIDNELKFDKHVLEVNLEVP